MREKFVHTKVERVAAVTRSSRPLSRTRISIRHIHRLVQQQFCLQAAVLTLGHQPIADDGYVEPLAAEVVRAPFHEHQ
jgi:hypothetical protein